MSKLSYCKILYRFGVRCTADEWLTSPERVLESLYTLGTAREVNQRRWGSCVPLRVDVQELRECKKHGLVKYDRKTGVWSRVNNTKT